MYASLVATLRARRESLKITQPNLALEMGIARSTLVKLESGLLVPSVETLCNWARALGLTLEAVIHLESGAA